MKFQSFHKVLLSCLVFFSIISTNAFAQLKNENIQKENRVINELFKMGYSEQALLYDISYYQPRTREQKYDRCLFVSTFVGATVLTGSLFLGWYLTDSTNYEEAALIGIPLGGLFGYSFGAADIC